MSEQTQYPCRRSWLFAPGNRPEVMAKAIASPAHAVILDLEDAVPEAEKAEARRHVANMLRSHAPASDIFVRINALTTPFAHQDIIDIAACQPAGIMLPKAESASDILTLDWLLSQLECNGGHRTSIVPLIETASGLAEVRTIATASDRIACLAFGAGDFTLDLALAWSRDESELLPARSEITLASRLAGLEPPVDSAWIAISDSEGMEASALRAREHGFQGKLCIHPRQVTAVNNTYAPSEEEVAKAHRIVEGFEAQGESNGSAVKIDGTMVDFPVVEAARRTLADHARAQLRTENPKAA